MMTFSHPLQYLLAFLASALLAYLLGAIPFTLIIGKIFFKVLN